MVDFKRLAQDAKAKHDSETATAAEKRRQEREARKQLVDTGIAVLNDHIKPLLEQAVSDLRAEGIELIVEQRFGKYALDIEAHYGRYKQRQAGA